MAELHPETEKMRRRIIDGVGKEPGSAHASIIPVLVELRKKTGANYQKAEQAQMDARRAQLVYESSAEAEAVTVRAVYVALYGDDSSPDGESPQAKLEQQQRAHTDDDRRPRSPRQRRNDMSDQHYYTVGVHGVPTPETAPHGVRWRCPPLGITNWALGTHSAVAKHHASEWAPLPAPPTEQAPPPEPVKRWRIWFGGPMGASFCGVAGTERHDISEQEALAAADALNVLERDGVAWGKGRPMEELPDGHSDRVLIAYLDGVGSDVMHGTCREDDAQDLRACWWPLPGEAT